MKLKYLFVILVLYGCKALPKQKIELPTKGYDFPEVIEQKDINFPFYPLRNILSKRDSLEVSYANSSFLHFFNEPNLSLKSSQKPVYRFWYEGSFDYPFMLILNEDEIIIKVATKNYYTYNDPENLNEIDKNDYYLLNRKFPLEENTSEKFQTRIDSIVKIRPQILNTDYYLSLLKKVEVLSSDTLSFTTRKKSITRSEYNRLAFKINASGFWSLPYSVECSNRPFDGSSFILEGNAGNKYNVVRTVSCSSDQSLFYFLCEELYEIRLLK